MDVRTPGNGPQAKTDRSEAKSYPTGELNPDLGRVTVESDQPMKKTRRPTMPVIRCPKCGNTGRLPPAYNGQQLRCKACGRTFTLPQMGEKKSGTRPSEAQHPPATPDALGVKKDEPVIARNLHCARCGEEYPAPLKMVCECVRSYEPTGADARGLIGRPGEVWINNTDRILYQFVPAFDQSCGLCIQYASKINLWWSKLHAGCLCTSHVIRPGQTSLPFIDFRERLESLDTKQQHAAMGKCNWILYKAGIVAWEDVVTSNRVREFHEVMDRNKLSLETMIQAGVPEEDARKARELVYTPERLEADRKAQEAIRGLRELGLSIDEISKAAAQGLGARVVGPTRKKRRR